MRLGRVEFNIGYAVDLDNEDMVDHAKEAIFEDIQSANRNGVSINIVKDKSDSLTENDIPEFLMEKKCAWCKVEIEEGEEHSFPDSDEIICSECHVNNIG